MAKYRIYSDESGWEGEFSSICAITVDTEKIEIADIEEKWKKKSEMKFHKTKSWKDIDNVMKILRSISPAGKGGLRMDILTWKRADKKKLNLKKQYGKKKSLVIMYYFLLTEIFDKQGRSIQHELYADEASYLEKQWKTLMKIFTDKEVAKELMKDFNYERIWLKKYAEIEDKFSLPDKKSEDHLFIQLSDIMAGFMRHTCDPKKDFHSFQANRYPNQKRDKVKRPEKYYKNYLCCEIHQWLKGIDIRFSYNEEGIANSPRRKNQAVNLWRFKSKDTQLSLTPNEVREDESPPSTSDESPPSTSDESPPSTSKTAPEKKKEKTKDTEKNFETEEPNTNQLSLIPNEGREDKSSKKKAKSRAKQVPKAKELSMS